MDGKEIKKEISFKKNGDVIIGKKTVFNIGKATVLNSQSFEGSTNEFVFFSKTKFDSEERKFWHNFNTISKYYNFARDIHYLCKTDRYLIAKKNIEKFKANSLLVFFQRCKCFVLVAYRNNA